MRTTVFTLLCAVFAALVMPRSGYGQLLSNDSAIRSDPPTRVYFPDTSDFPNPERGWIWTNEVFCGPVPISVVDFDSLRAQHITMIDPIYVLDDFRESELSQDLLELIESDFALARAEGFKLMPRFSYNWNAVCTGDEDAALGRIEQHVAQLAPILQANEDVIAVLHVSFIGLYGEMHSSSNGHIVPGTVRFSASGVAAFEAILDSVPIRRAWCIRYPQQKRQLFAGNLNPTDAFGVSDRARIGLTNHGFAADETDFGTWSGDPVERAEEKAWAEFETRFVPQFGEPAGSNNPAIAFDSAYALAELERFHYSGLAINQNDAANAGVYDAWVASGAFAEMSTRFGYRYELTTARLRSAGGSGAYELELGVRNVGFAVPINARAVEVVLRSGNETVRLGTNIDDIRPAFPAAGESDAVSVHFEIPKDLPTGRYEVLLSLPDPSPALRDRTAYAIRLASLGVWEPESGFNRLGLSLRVP